MIDINQLPEFDPAEYLEDDEDISLFLEEVFKSKDPQHIANAIGIVARARGLNEIAKKSGLRREYLYQVLSPKGNPTLSTLIPILEALDIDLTVRHHSLRHA